MTKWADYLISSVNYVETKTTKHISKVMVHIDDGGDVGLSTVWTRKQVLDSIDMGNTFITIVGNSDGKSYNKGAFVKKIWEFNDWYIKTKSDNTTTDNLGELPEF